MSVDSLVPGGACARRAARRTTEIAKKFVRRTVGIAKSLRLRRARKSSRVCHYEIDRYTAVMARDVWRFGPPRGYWCFGFESFNRVIKAGAQHSNWKRSSLSIMQYWSMQSARGLVKRRRSQWCEVAPALECLC